MQVWVVIRVIPDFTGNIDGSNAQDRREVEGVYATRALAEQEKTRIESDDLFRSCWCEIEEFTLHGVSQAASAAITSLEQHVAEINKDIAAAKAALEG